MPIVGSAAFLAPEEDERTLGAALITVIVEEDVAQKLYQAARERMTAWRRSDIGQVLYQAYQAILSQVWVTPSSSLITPPFLCFWSELIK